MFLGLKGPRGNIVLVSPNFPLVPPSTFQSFKIYLIRFIFFDHPSPTIQHHLNLNISIIQIWNSDKWLLSLRGVLDYPSVDKGQSWCGNPSPSNASNTGTSIANGASSSGE